MRKNKTLPIAYQLAPGQTLKQYKALETLWYSKIRATDFLDIEFLDNRGYPSPYSRDYSLARLRTEYTPEKAEYFRRASIFMYEFKWLGRDLKGLSPTMARFIWAHYAEGFTLRQIVKALNGTGPTLIKGPKPRKRTVKGSPRVAPSLFWVHHTLTHTLIPAFEAWCKGPGKELLGVDWDLEAP